MKNVVRYLQVIPATFLILACANEKEPVADLATLRAKAAESEARSKQPQTLPTPVKEYVVKTETKREKVEVPVFVPKEVVVPKLVERLSSDYLIITPPERVTFTEGTTSTFTVKVRCTIPECTPSLTAEELPEGATFKKETNAETSTTVYKMTWTPKLGITDANTGLTGAHSTFKATATVKDPAKNATFKNFNKSAVVSYQVTRAPIVVKDVAIVGLPAEIQEGGQADFSVTARITGIDPQSAAKPTLTRTDDVSTGTPDGPVEIGGAGFIPRYQAAEHIGNSVWKFNLKFDTKNFVVPKTGTSDVARAGFAFQVCMSGVCSDEKAAKINIKFTKPTVATVGKK